MTQDKNQQSESFAREIAEMMVKLNMRNCETARRIIRELKASQKSAN